MLESKQKLIFLIYILLLIHISHEQNKEQTQNIVSIRTHKWCEKSLIGLKIITKAEQIYGESIKFQRIVVDQLLLEHQKPFPQIIINCSSSKIFYENDLTLIQFEYWLKLHCLQEIPKCSKSTENKYLAINPKISSSSQFNKLRVWLARYPAVKVCQSQKIPSQSMHTVIKTLNSLLQLPYFLRFTHNIRNQLIQSESVCILMVSLQKKSAKIKDFTQMATFLQKKSDKLGYHIKNNDRNKVMFVSDSVENKLVVKLMSFLKIKGEKLSDYQGIYAFGFKNNQLWGLKYQGQVDNHLIFWIQQILNYKNTIHQKPICLANKIQHYYSTHSLESIKRDIQFLKAMKKMQTKMQIQSINKIWVPNHQFRLCIQQKEPFLTSSLAQIQQKIAQTNQNINQEL